MTTSWINVTLNLDVRDERGYPTVEHLPKEKIAVITNNGDVGLIIAVKEKGAKKFCYEATLSFREQRTLHVKEVK